MYNINLWKKLICLYIFSNIDYMSVHIVMSVTSIYMYCMYIHNIDVSECCYRNTCIAWPVCFSSILIRYYWLNRRNVSLMVYWDIHVCTGSVTGRTAAITCHEICSRPSHTVHICQELHVTMLCVWEFLSTRMEMSLWDYSMQWGAFYLNVCTLLCNIVIKTCLQSWHATETPTYLWCVYSHDMCN